MTFTQELGLYFDKLKSLRGFLELLFLKLPNAPIKETFNFL